MPPCKGGVKAKLPRFASIDEDAIYCPPRNCVSRDAVQRALHRVIANIKGRIEVAVYPGHHQIRLRTPPDKVGGLMHLLRLDIRHPPMGVRDYYLLGVGFQRPLDRGVKVANHQPPPVLVLLWVAAGHTSAYYAADTLHVYGDENLLTFFRHFG